MNKIIRAYINQPKIISEIDGLPSNLFIIEIGYVEHIVYTSGKTWNKYNVVKMRLFSDIVEACENYIKHKNEIVGNRYMRFYNYQDDGDKILLACELGKNVNKNNYI